MSRRSRNHEARDPPLMSRRRQLAILRLGRTVRWPVSQSACNGRREAHNHRARETGRQTLYPGLRITVDDVLSYLASGMTEDQILTDFPDLEREDLRALYAFAADRERRLLADPAA